MNDLFDYLLAIQKGGGGGGGGGSTAKVLWEGDVSTTPQEFDYEFNPITCDYYFNDELYYNIMWQSYDDEDLYTITFAESQVEVGFGVYHGNDIIFSFLMATGAGHLKIVEKTNKCLMIDAIYQSDQYTVIQTSFYDILDALKNGYVLTLHVNGMINGTNYDSIGPISASYIHATNTAIFTAGVTKGTAYFTWTVSADGSIVGTIGGGVDGGGVDS